MRNVKFSLGPRKMGDVVTHLLNFAKALLHLLVHAKYLSFFNKENNGNAILTTISINRL